MRLVASGSAGAPSGVENLIPLYSGGLWEAVKFSTPDGAPALPEATKRIEAEIAASDAASGQPRVQNKSVAAQALEPRSSYLARLRELSTLRRSKRPICA